MDRCRRLSFLLGIAALGIACATARGGAAPTRADIDKTLAAVAGYATGQSRAPLFAVEEILRKTNGNTALRRHIELGLVKLLESDAGHDTKLFACQQLWAVGSDASVPTLEKMLVGETTSHMACYALGKHPSPRVGLVARNALVVAKGKALIGIIDLLGERRDGASVGALGKLAARGDAAVAKAAVTALGKIGTEGAAQVLAGVRKKGGALRAAAAHACLQCAQRLVADGNTAKAAALYREMFAAAEPKLIRRGALVGLMAAEGAEAAPLVIAVLRGEDRMLRAAAIAGVCTLRGRAVAARFAAELPKLPPHVQVLLIGALASRDDAAVAPAIAASAQSANAEVRAAALKALGQIGDATSVALLARAVEGAADEAERDAALVSLRQLRDKRSDAALARAMKAAGADARARLIEVLHDRNATEAVPALLEEAGKGEPAVRRAAFKALGRLAGPGALPKLLELLVGLKGDGGRRDAERAVVTVSRKIANEAACADAALAALRGARGAAARCSLLRVLRGAGNAKALDAVQAALKDGDRDVREAAVRGLADWPNAAAVGALMGIIRTTKDDTHRVVALRGCVRLLGLPGELSVREKMTAFQEAMGHTRQAAEKKLVLAGLANVGRPEALKLVEPCLADGAVRAEAELAMVRIARATAGAYRQQARAAMQRFLAVSKNAQLRSQAEAVVRQIDKLGDYLTAWQVAGPYAEAGKDFTQLFEMAFPPEKADAGDVPWRLLPVPTTGGRPWMLDLLGPLGGGEQRVAYVRTWVHSGTQQPARLELGTDDGNKVWFNGKVVHGKNGGGAAIPGQYKVGVTLRQGWNTLFLKITQCSGPWQFCARLVRPNGGRLEGLKVQATPPAMQ